jgi:hypothetical protein
MPIRRIHADLSELRAGARQYVLDADAAAGATSVTVRSIIGAAVNRILLFREFGNEASEIIATHAVTTPSGNTITLVAAGLVEAHPAGTVIYEIPANQIRFYRSATEDDANSSDTGLTALAAAANIDPTTIRNYYDDTVQTSGFYYYRFIDSINSVNLLYSDPIPWGQIQVEFEDDEVGFVIEFIRNKLGHEWDDRFSKQRAIDEINACLRYIQNQFKKWKRYLTPDFALGQTSRGVFDFALPADIYDNQTNRSILQVRLGAIAQPLIYKDEKEMDAIMADVKRTTVRTAAVVGATTLAITNSYDFDASGTVNVMSANVVDAITYTGVTRSATVGVLTGVPATGAGAIGAAHAVGINVWQGEEEGQPVYWNVRNGRLRFYPLSDSDHINKNVVIDYYTEATVVNSESDTIDALRHDMIVNWLLWQGKAYWRNNGNASLDDADFKLFLDALKTEKRTAPSGEKFRWHPKVNTISYKPLRGDRRFDYT